MWISGIRPLGSACDWLRHGNARLEEDLLYARDACAQRDVGAKLFQRHLERGDCAQDVESVVVATVGDTNDSAFELRLTVGERDALVLAYLFENHHALYTHRHV